MFKTLACLVVVLACVSAQRPVTCGGACTTDANCQGTCTQCIFGNCGSGCNFYCNNNTNCLDPNCPFCYNGRCGNSPQLGCGGKCIHNTDCNQNPAVNLCRICQNGVCTARCGGSCSNDTQCLTSGCNKCQVQTRGTKVCVKSSGSCGTHCTTNDECDQSGVCNQCLLGVCGAGCGSRCTASTQCLDGNCLKCNKSGQCAKTSGGKTCGGSCLLNSDCSVSPSNCGKCIFGRCGAACADTCVKSSDCLTAGCQVCTNSTAGGKICSYPPPEN